MRAKIIAGNLIAVLFVGLVSYVLLYSKIKRHAAEAAESSLEHQQILFERSWKLSGSEFVEEAREQARSKTIQQVFTGLDEQSKRSRAFNAIGTVEQWFADPSRHRASGPDVVVIVDETGKVIARNKDINRMVGESLQAELPSVQTALREDQVLVDVWHKKDEQKVFQTAIAPITSESGVIIGGLVVAYDISNGFAAREAEVLGCDVAFITGEGVYSSSLDSARVGELRTYLAGQGKSTVQSALASGRAAGSKWEADLGGHDVVGVLSYLPTSQSKPVVYSISVDRTQATSWVSVLNMLLILTALGVVAVIGYGSVVGSAILRPIEEIEDGILRIINGNTDYRLDVHSPELGGLAYRINQLVNVFTGVNEEDDDGRVSMPPEGTSGGEWQGKENQSSASNNPPA